MSKYVSIVTVFTSSNMSNMSFKILINKSSNILQNINLAWLKTKFKRVYNIANIFKTRRTLLFFFLRKCLDKKFCWLYRNAKASYFKGSSLSRVINNKPILLVSRAAMRQRRSLIYLRSIIWNNININKSTLSYLLVWVSIWFLDVEKSYELNITDIIDIKK